MHDRSDPDGARQSAQVLRFRLRKRARLRPVHGAASEPNDSAPFDDLAQYEQVEEHDSDRHRMLMNLIAVVVVAVLVGVGVWIADIITDLERDQDCVLQGRQNCAPIEVPAAKR